MALEAGASALEANNGSVRLADMPVPAISTCRYACRKNHTVARTQIADSTYSVTAWARPVVLAIYKFTPGLKYLESDPSKKTRSGINQCLAREIPSTALDETWQMTFISRFACSMIEISIVHTD